MSRILYFSLAVIATALSSVVGLADDKPTSPKRLVAVDPYLRKYEVPSGAAETVAESLRKQFPDIRLVALPSTNEVMVMATEQEHAKIAAMLKDRNEDAKKPEPKKYPVQIKDVPWDTVLKWYVEISGLTGSYNYKPNGNVTIESPMGKTYTLAEVTDLINEALQQQKFILIRGKKSFFLHPADEKVDRTLVPRIEPSELSDRGRTELVEVEMRLPAKEDAKNLASELVKLTSPFGSITPTPANSLLILDTAGNVGRIASVCRSPNGDLFDPRFNAPREQPPVEPKRLPMKPTDAPWTDVLAWYAEISGLTPILPVRPSGKFSFKPPTPDRRYTLAEITDILNEALVPQKLVLVRRRVTFFLVPASEIQEGATQRINVPEIESSRLPEYGNTELVRVLIPLRTSNSKDTVPELKKLLSPLGSIGVLEKTNTLVIVDNAKSVWNIYKLVGAIEKPEPKKKQG